MAIQKNDVSANEMYDRAKIKGNISNMDKSKLGLLVHIYIGIYIGNDEVIECIISTLFAKQSHGLCEVCKTRLNNRKWEYWLECSYITYVNN